MSSSRPLLALTSRMRRRMRLASGGDGLKRGWSWFAREAGGALAKWGPGGLLRLWLRSGRPPTSRALPPLPVSMHDDRLISTAVGLRACSRDLPRASVRGMRMLHTMLRVGNLERSLSFYCDVLGMRLLRRNDYPGGRFTLAFVGYGDERDHTVIEFTHNWDTERYELGNAFGHIALGVDDVYQACDELRRKGAKVVREPGPMKHGGSEIAFIEDPDGYRIELIQLRGRSD